MKESFQINIKDMICPNNRNGRPVQEYNKRDLSRNTNMMLCPEIEFDYEATPTGKTAFSRKAPGSAAQKQQIPANKSISINKQIKWLNQQNEAYTSK